MQINIQQIISIIYTYLMNWIASQSRIQRIKQKFIIIIIMEIIVYGFQINFVLIMKQSYQQNNTANDNAKFVTELMAAYNVQHFDQKISQFNHNKLDHNLLPYWTKITKILLFHFNREKQLRNWDNASKYCRVVANMCIIAQQSGAFMKKQGFLLKKTIKIMQKSIPYNVVNLNLVNQKSTKLDIHQNKSSNLQIPQIQQLKLADLIINSEKTAQCQPYFNGCLGCCSQFYQHAHIPQTDNFHFVVDYNSNMFQEDFTSSVCAALNEGGGYIFINGRNSQYIQGITNLVFDQNYALDLLNSPKIAVMPLQYKIQIKIIKIRSSSTRQVLHNKQVIRIQVLPLKYQIFYVQHQIKTNKAVRRVYVKKQNKIVEIDKQNIYKLFTKTFKIFNMKKFYRPCYTCIPVASKKLQKIYSQLGPQLKNDEDMPYYKYKNSTMLAISSTKYEQTLISKIKAVLSQKKINVFMNKPFVKYTKSSTRAVWFISHDCQFQILNKAIRGVDDDNKCRCIIVTKILQVRSYNKQNEIKRMQNIVISVFDCQIQKRQSLQKVSPTSLVMAQYVYLKFGEYNESILAFIYLENLQVRSEFVQEFFMNSGHKLKKAGVYKNS